MSANKSFLGFQFKWKHWYWYLALFTNVFSTILLAINLIASSSLGPSNPTSHSAYYISSSCVLFLSLLVYLVNTMKETRLCKTLIKPERNKILQWGSFCSFMVVNFYWIFNLIANSISSEWPLYISVALTAIFGVISSALLTYYEFCISFDVFYHKNKTEIVHNFFKQFDKSEIKKAEINNSESTESK